jgi:hypothetical protein
MGQAEVFDQQPQKQKALPGITGRGFYYSSEF